MSAKSSGHSECWCHYLPNLVTVPANQREQAINAKEGGRTLENGEACRLLDGLDHEIVGEILERVGVIQIDDEDPHDWVNDLNARGIDASPIHGVGFLGHGGFQGSDWAEAPSRSLPRVGDAEKGVIAAVDSGLVPADDLPDWMNEPNSVCSRPVDTENLAFHNPIGHGTYVTSLLRRVAPQFQVSITSARPDPGHLRTNDPDHRSAPPPTDELNVLGAVLRLLRRHGRGKERVDALNLSLGVHACPGDESRHFVALRVACMAWMDEFRGDAPIFAAAGNSLCPEPLYPAAFSRERELSKSVRAVAAGREGRKEGEVKVWDRGTEVAAPHRDWVTDVAPGCDLLGLTGQAADHLAWWSGSSHATAVATALHVTGNRPVNDSGIDWWPDRALSSSAVPGLLP